MKKMPKVNEQVAPEQPMATNENVEQVQTNVNEGSGVEQPEAKAEETTQVKSNDEGVEKQVANDEGEKPNGVDSRIEELENKLNEAVKVNEKAIQLTKTVETLNGQIEQSKNVIAEYEEMLTSIIDGKVAKVPEQFKELVPTHLSLKEKLAWLDKAEETGLFGQKEKQANPDVEIGKPMNIDAPKVDANKLTVSQKLSMAFNTIAR